MKLRARFTLWFCLAALVPIAAAALAARTVISSTLREDADRVREMARGQMQGVLDQLDTKIVGRVGGLVTREDPYVGGTLLELHKFGGILPSHSRKRVREIGNSLMRQISLDLLVLSDHNNEVLDAPHFPPLMGEFIDDRLGELKSAGEKPYYVMRSRMDDGQLVQYLVVEAGKTLVDREYAVTVFGGQEIGASTFDAVTKDAVQVRVVAPTGEVLVEPTRSWDAQNRGVDYALLGANGELVATVQMQFGNDSLPALLQKVTIYSVGLALCALAITVLLGFLSARRITSDLDELVAGAHAVAEGQLDQQVKVNSRDEVGEVGLAFNTMVTELKESKERLVMAERVAAWQEIARRLAHEIKNPLTPIQMSMETLRKTFAKKHPSFEEVLEESTATVLEEAGRLRRIVSEFSEFARMPKPNKTEVEVNELLRSHLSLYGEGLRIEKNFDESLPAIQADRDTLSQVLLNLIENARDATRGEDAPAIRVTTERGGTRAEMLLVHIDDNGPGIAPEYKEKLFTPYFTTKHAHGGTGLGLAIAHRIVLDHGGQISAGEGPLGGARFTIELPTRVQEQTGLG